MATTAENEPAWVLDRPPGEALGLRPRRPRLLRLVAAGLIALLYVAGISRHWWLGPDTGLYVSLADSLARGEGYTLAGRPHAHVPPGFPALLALLGGSSHFLLLNAAMATMALGFIWFARELLAQLVEPGWADLLALTLALSTQMYERSTEILSDIPFMLAVLGGLWLYYRGLRRGGRGWELGSLLIAGSCWFRVAALAVAAGAALGLVASAWRTPLRRRAILNLLLAGAIGAGSLAFFYRAYKSAGAYDSSYANLVSHLSSGQLTGWLAAQGGGALDVLSKLLTAQDLPPAVTLLVIVLPMAVGLFRRAVRGDHLGPIVVVVYLLMLLAVKFIPRYLLLVMPLLLLYWLEGAMLAAGWAARRLRRGPRPAGVHQARVAVALLAVLAAANLPLVGRRVYERHADWRLQQRGKFVDEIAAAAELERLDPPGRLLAPQYLAVLAHRPSPMVPAGIRKRDPSAEQVRRFLSHWDIRVVVVNLARTGGRGPETPRAASLSGVRALRGPDSADAPFQARLAEIARQDGRLLAQVGQVAIFELLTPSTAAATPR